jgi:hypothetical protein
MALFNIDINVSLQPGNFIASALHLSNTASTMASAIEGLVDELVAAHEALQGLPADWLTQEAQYFRETSIV